MNKQVFISQRLFIHKNMLYFFIINSLIFLVLTPFSNVTRVSINSDASLSFSLFIILILIYVFYIYRNYIIKTENKIVKIYLPFGIKRKAFLLNQITQYKLISEGIEWGNSRNLTLFSNQKTVLKINSFNYSNAHDLFEKIISGLNKEVVKIKN